MARVIDAILRLRDNFTPVMNRAQQNIVRHAREAQRLGREIDKIGQNFERLGGTLTSAVTMPLAGFAAVAIKTGAEFEKEMSNLASITGMTADEMKQMERGIRDIAVASGQSVMEIATNAKMLAEAGGDMDLMMGQLAHGTNLAAATQSDLATTLDFLGSSMKTFGLEAEDTQAVVDSFAYVTTMANLELSQLAESYVNVGGAAAGAGMGINDVNAILIQLSNAGLKGGAAGTSLNAILRNLSTPTDKAAKALKGLGVSLYDSAGVSRDMFDVMKDLEDALGGLTEKQRNEAQAAIFDSVALKSWNMIAADGIDTIAELSGELAGVKDAFDGLGQAAGMAAIQDANVLGQISAIKANISELGIQLYQILLPYLEKLLSTGLSVVNSIVNMEQSTKEFIVRVAMIAAVVGPALLAFGMLTRGVGGALMAFGSFGKALGRAGSLMKLIFSPANVVVLVIAAIAVAAFLIIKNWKPIKAFFIDTFNKIKAVLTDAGVDVGALAEHFKWFAGKSREVFGLAANWITVNLQKAFAFIKDTVLPAAKDAFIKALPIIIDVIKKAVVFTRDVMLPAFKKAFGYIKDTIIPVFIEIFNKIKPVVQDVINAVVPFVKDILFPAFKQVFGIISEKVIPAFSKAIAFLIPIIKDLIKFLIDGFNEIWGFVEPWLNFFIDYLRVAISVAIEVFGSLIDSAVEIFDGLATIFDGIVDFIVGIFTGNWEQAWEGVKNIFKGIFDTFVAIAKTPINTVISLINGVIGSINKMGITIPDWIPELGGKTFGVNIPKIPMLYTGTDNWRGGTAMIHDKGAEIVDLPRGSRVYPHDKSLEMAKAEGRKKGGISVVEGIFDIFAAIAKTQNNTVAALMNSAVGGVNIPKIPMLYTGTDNWRGGTAMIHDKGAEIVDLPRGSRVYPHDKSLEMAKAEGRKKGGISVVIQKVADTVYVRDDSDIDQLVQKTAKLVARELLRVKQNMG